MKQILICQNKDYATTPTSAYNLNELEEGVIGIYKLSDYSLVSNKITENFMIAVGRGYGKMPIIVPEVDYKSLQVTIGQYQEATVFSATITIPTPTVGEDYTVIIAKKGLHFNERNSWSFNAFAKTKIAADVAKTITDNINANTPNLGVTASYSGGAITITAVEAGPDYEVLGADALMGVEPTDVTNGAKAVLDKAYVQELASKCAAGKGFNYTDNPEIYPGYPEEVDSDAYVMYTLRFAVPRASAKQRDEVVYQTVHICIPNSSTDEISTLNDIFTGDMATELLN